MHFTSSSSSVGSSSTPVYVSSIGTINACTVSTSPTYNSTNLITSGAVYSALNDKFGYGVSDTYVRISKVFGGSTAITIQTPYIVSTYGGETDMIDIVFSTNGFATVNVRLSIVPTTSGLAVKLYHNGGTCLNESSTFGEYVSSFSYSFNSISGIATVSITTSSYIQSCMVSYSYGFSHVW